MEQSNANIWPQLDRGALHGLAGDIVRAIDPHTEADSAALLVQFVVAFGNMVGRGPYFACEADAHPTVLFAAVVGETAKARKGTSWGYVQRLGISVDGAWGGRVQSGLSSGEGLIHAVRDGSGDDPGVEDKRLLVQESELGGALRAIERQGNTLSPVVRQAWDSGNLRVLTRTNPIAATGAHVSIIAHITLDELRRYLSQTEVANGFSNRFLWVCARRSKSLPEGGRFTGEEQAPFVDRFRKALVFARRVDRVERDADAADLWKEVYDDLSEGQPGLFGAVTSRAEAQVARLSLVYALLDHADTIGRPHLEAALRDDKRPVRKPVCCVKQSGTPCERLAERPA